MDRRRVHAALLAVVALAAAAAGDNATSSIGGATAAAAEAVVVHRRVLATTSIQDSVLDGDRPACLRTPCSGRGQSYTGRGCAKAYGCQG
uniref:Uncharacterized protein n=1 Tax=Oryza glumipatula TaxID=40148 RepID=A0A0D9ZJF7_9ORYZ